MSNTSANPDSQSKTYSALLLSTITSPSSGHDLNISFPEPVAAADLVDLPIPTPGPGQLLVRVHAVSLNPSDWMGLPYARPGSGIGCDFAGTVVAIGGGENESKSEEGWVVGERVCGLVHGLHAENHATGAFKEYVLVDADLVMKVPRDMDFERASTLGMGVATAAQALYQTLGLPLPLLPSKRGEGKREQEQEMVLIYGGGTATGLLAVQLAKLSNYKVITTCSRTSKARLESISLKPDLIVDYADPDSAISEIRAFATRNKGLTRILDCVASDATGEFCYRCFTTPSSASHEHEDGYIYAPLLPFQSEMPRPPHIPASASFTAKSNLVYTCFGRRFTILGQVFEASAEDRAFMGAFYRRFEAVLATGSIAFMPVEVKGYGLGGVMEAVEALKKRGSGGVKWVFRVC